jgi:folate-binding protein YgfZ
VIPEYYQAATNSAALAEMDWFGTVKLSGSDRVTWLQGMVTNDVQKLQPGTGCYAAHLTPQGKIVAQMHILADDDALWLSLERASIPNLLSAFDKLLIMEDVQVEDVSNDYSVLVVMGPKALAVIESWTGEPLNLTDKYAHRCFEDCRVIVSDLGYEVWAPRGKADNVLRFIAHNGATAIDRGTWDVLRTELGIPVYGVDIDETTIMPEIGEAGISYEKGCYIGQEVVAKVKYIGHINRRFAGLTFPGAELPQLKSVIRKGGRDVGYVTTALFSPALNKPIALGFVSRAAYAPGTEVEVVSGDRVLRGSVVELPFISHGSFE